MKFGPVSLDDAVGAVLAHSVRLSGGRVKKGTVLDAAVVERLRADGVERVVCARLDADDVDEDTAARRIGDALAGGRVRAAEAATGRVNLYAEADGVLAVDAAAVGRLNAVHEAVTLATLPAFARVGAGQMVATVKIIPYAVPGTVVDGALAAAGGAALAVAPFRPLQAALIATVLPGDKASLAAKRRSAVADRVTGLGGRLAFERDVAHETDAVRRAVDDARAAGADIVLVFGAAAISDRDDVIPAALVEAGGRVERLGMPVDPGNLALLGVLDDKPFVGVPSCAASPKPNGFDWILERLFAGLALDSQGVGVMGVGGLLSEIPTRPRPREGRAGRAPAHGPVAALVLAAGRSSRMGERFKLTEALGGKPIVRHVVEAALGSLADEVVVVTGHRAADVEAALDGLDARRVHNADFAEGLASSLRAGVAALAPGTAACLVFLGDMPLIEAASADALIERHKSGDGRAICVPVHDGRRGNPVLWPAAFFETLAGLDGDRGARSVIADHPEAVAEVAVASEGVLVDVDTAEALAALRAGAD